VQTVEPPLLMLPGPALAETLPPSEDGKAQLPASVALAVERKVGERQVVQQRDERQPASQASPQQPWRSWQDLPAWTFALVQHLLSLDSVFFADEGIVTIAFSRFKGGRADAERLAFDVASTTIDCCHNEEDETCRVEACDKKGSETVRAAVTTWLGDNPSPGTVIKVVLKGRPTRCQDFHEACFRRAPPGLFDFGHGTVAPPEDFNGNVVTMWAGEVQVPSEEPVRPLGRGGDEAKAAVAAVEAAVDAAVDVDVDEGKRAADGDRRTATTTPSLDSAVNQWHKRWSVPPCLPLLGHDFTSLGCACAAGGSMARSRCAYMRNC
jgi:hypothetical protein